ncbi:DUF397 domain-containing protein [Streptomyces sp. NPDC020965]|uniref:DUF397 domain-containing protein n=1 Tax=Streptomyces sp. NPDC020965 TaxID=3365105 RepID=UPI0037A5AC46
MTQGSVPGRCTGERDEGLWHTSSLSGSNTNCVEHRRLGSGHQAIRDSKDRGRGALVFAGAIWQRFLDGIRGGELGD